MTALRRECAGWRSGAGDVPTVLRSGPYRLYFYSNERDEPPHIHVDRDRQSAKFWLGPISAASNFGFSARELGIIEAIVLGNEDSLLEAWNEFHGA